MEIVAGDVCQTSNDGSTPQSAPSLVTSTTVVTRAGRATTAFYAALAAIDASRPGTLLPSLISARG
jgi:hypothetical protein